MNAEERMPESERMSEIMALIETLHRAEQRIAELTAGEVDAVSNHEGRVFLLQRAQERLRVSEALKQAAILDVLPAQVALLDTRGRIVCVNKAWRAFGLANFPGELAPDHGVGVDYLDLCHRVLGPESIQVDDLRSGLDRVLKGDLKSFCVDYACQHADERRWFQLTICPLADQPPTGVVVMQLDVTEPMRARESLKRSTELLQVVAAGIPDMLFVKDAQGRYLLCNEAFSRFVGRPIEQIIGQGNEAVFAPESARELTWADERVMRSNDAVSSETVLNGVAGTKTFFNTKAPYRDAGGKAIGVIGISRDITERKRAEQDLRESQALLSMAGRLAQVGSWVVELPATTMAWSDVLAAMHGEPAGFLPSVEQAFAYYAPEHQAGIREAFARCMNEGASFDVESQILTAQGVRLWVRAIGEAVRDGDGVIRRVQGALQDISQRKETERETRLLAARLTNTLESITDGFLTLDRAWRYTYVNQEALRMLGLDRAELVGRVMWEAFPLSLGTAFEHGCRRAMDAREATSFDAFYEPWKAWISVHCYPSEEGLSIYFRDVTERKFHQDALREMNATLELRVATRTSELNLAREGAEQANRAKSAFLAAMSHEIRTPMNGVVGMIDVLEQSNLKKSQADIVRTIRESAYALLGIVDDVLDFSKIEAGHLQIESEPFSIEQVVERVCATLDHLASSKGVLQRLFVDPAIPGSVLGDAARLRQVLLNLAGNAIKFSSALGLAGRVDVRVVLVQRGQKAVVEFSVSDNGIGMDEATLGRLFTPFTQADESTTKRFGGTGLGLSISGRLVELMGGDIEVASQPGQGSTFTVRLGFDADLGPPGPALPGVEEEPAFTEAETDAAPFSDLAVGVDRPLILVVEDNDINQRVIRSQLALLGLSADIVDNGTEALAQWRRVDYALLLTDLHMPLMDGYELCTAIRDAEAGERRIPIVALTANALKGEEKRCKDLGMDDYMTKPLQLYDLYAMLQKWMPASGKPARLRHAGHAHPNPRVRPVSPPADLGVLARLVGNDPLVIRGMLHAFRESALRLSEAIRQGMADGDEKRVGEAAHSLKSGARSIGALCLGTICDDMEAASYIGQCADLLSQLSAFELEMSDVHRFLDKATSHE
jgi:PAS domain S-box-containing protein